MAITTKKVSAGNYKGSYKGVSFNVTKGPIDNYSSDLWWFGNINGTEVDPVPTKKTALRWIKEMIENNEF